MCFGGTSRTEMVIHSDKPLAEAEKDYGFVEKDGSPMKDPDELPKAPDATDERLTAMRKSQMLGMLTSHGRSSTFLTGPRGDPTAEALGQKKLGGG